MIALEFKPSPRSRDWRRSSLRMHPEGRANMEKTAAALATENNWHAWRIVAA